MQTQIQAAKQGILTKQMQDVINREGIGEAELIAKVASGTICIPANVNHKSLVAVGIGEGMSTKINVNLGISRDCPNYTPEKEKVQKAIEMGADAIMDLSSYGKTYDFRGWLIDNAPCAIGTVPMYDAIGFLEKELADMTKNDLFDVVETHAKQGVDFVTIHAALNRATAERFKRNKRLTNIVSRGGSLLFAYMELTGKENPFYENYDELLELLRAYDVTISIGDACRPGSIADSTDASQVEELITIGELTRRAWARDVAVLVEGPGHMAINEIAANMTLQKRLCDNAPFYVLGPLVTDVAPGYDHITSAIGGAIAAANGADFLCYVTPAEHLRLPDLDDMKQGIIASKIAAHAADIAKGIKGARDWDNKMSEARRELDWEEMLKLAIDPETARRYHDSAEKNADGACTMCGKMCAVRNMNTIMKGEKLTLL